ncbi:hypothetical protein H8B13_18140 [Hymenobacter sp. BT188]|uniref:hypothetical protein n=1 Tax=Hymenobacter sp. BT188 TaxID=2763504 RepID=UPI0016513C6B|nr:hypothetical protein [Hymenobacter sp. BT188]MBC6608754.1 hypothetical protein [Hymenobacter sp. BT188]
MRRNYGAQQTSKEQLAQVAMPLEPAPFKLGEMKWHEHLHPQAYIERELARLNEHLTQQLALVNAKLQEVAQVATANALAQERARVLEKRVITAEQTLQATEQQFQATQMRLREAQASHTKLNHVAQQLAVHWVQGEKPGEPVVALAEQVREQARRRMEQAAAEVLEGPLHSSDELKTALQAKGYLMCFDPPKGTEITCQATGTRVPRDQVRPNGQDMQDQMEAAITRTQTQEYHQSQQQTHSRGVGK